MVTIPCPFCKPTVVQRRPQGFPTNFTRVNQGLRGCGPAVVRSCGVVPVAILNFGAIGTIVYLTWNHIMNIPDGKKVSIPNIEELPFADLTWPKKYPFSK